MLIILTDPNSLPESWRKFFDGLSDDEKLIYQDLNGPSWSPEKKIKKLDLLLKNKNIHEETSRDLNSSSVNKLQKTL